MDEVEEFMTRETKVGLGVAGSFICLVAVVVAAKFHATDPTPAADAADAGEAVAAADKAKADKKKEPHRSVAGTEVVVPGPGVKLAHHQENNSGTAKPDAGDSRAASKPPADTTNKDLFRSAMSIPAAPGEKGNRRHDSKRCRSKKGDGGRGTAGRDPERGRQSAAVCGDSSTEAPSRIAAAALDGGGWSERPKAAAILR